MTFDIPFKEVEDQAAFKTDILDALTKAGADPSFLAKIKIKLREGSVVAELRGPAASVGSLRRLPLESLELSNGLRPAKVEYHVATKGEGEAEEDDSPAEPPMAPRNVSQDQRASARGSARDSARDSARAKAGGAATGSAALSASQSLTRDSQSTVRQFFEAEVGAEVKRLGFSFTTPSGNPLGVKTVTPGLWAEGVGVEVGDEILEINGQPTKGMGVEEVKKHVSQRPLAFKFGKKLQEDNRRNSKGEALSPRNKGDISTRSSRGNLSPRSSPRSPEELAQEKVNLEAELLARETKVGPDAPELEPLLQALARVYGRLEETGRQKEVLERTLQILAKGQNPAERKKSAAVMKDLSMLYAKQEDHQHRQALLEQACEIEEADLGHDNVDTAITRARLANACGKNGDTKRQAMLLETSLPVLERANHHDLVAILSNLGSASAANGDHARAKECFERALEMKEKEKGKDHIQLADVLVGLAEVHGNLQELPQQRACLERALKIKETAYGPDDGKVTVTLANLGSVCRRMGDAESAKDVFERTLATKEKQYGPDHAQVALTLANLAAAYGDLGETTKQRELVQRALTIFERVHGPDHAHTQLAKKMIAKIDKKAQGKPGNEATPQSSRSSLGKGAK
jgi:tetratricopeptide (TPR) repeat protein